VAEEEEVDRGAVQSASCLSAQLLSGGAAPYTTKRHYTMNDESSEDETGSFVKKQKTKKVALTKHNGQYADTVI
jgi:hypothetical protein